MKAKSYVYGAWHQGDAEGVSVANAITGEPICSVSSDGIDFEQVVRFGKEVGGPALRAMTIHERAEMLKALGLKLLDNKKRFYDISQWTGATKADSWVDIEGGLGTMLSYSSIARRELGNEPFIVEDAAQPLSADGSFVGRHILTSKPGVSVHINAFNFPCWGMLEKIAPSLIAGVPVIVKPATQSAYLTQAMVEDMVESGLLPKGAIQLICGSVGDLLDHLREQDCVTFTGSASTGQMLKVHPNIVANSIPFNMEADSLNCSILGESVKEEDPEFGLFIKEITREMTIKAGQKCTAIRRALVPRSMINAVNDALKTRLSGVAIGDPSVEGVKMGPLIGKGQREDVASQVSKLCEQADVLLGGNDAPMTIIGDHCSADAFYPPTVLLSKNPSEDGYVHSVEAFGPVCTLLPYDSVSQAIEIAALGRGSLVGSVITHNPAEAAELVLNAAPYHGRILVLNRDNAKASTGHGSPLAPLVHGGPGRAGGGEELGGVRAIKHYMQRTALQGSPSMLTAMTREYTAGADKIRSPIHPFRKYFDELQISESLTTHRRTVTEADIVNFGCLSGDHFYAHFDDIAAKDSLFGQRVAHGYFVLSAAAGLFVDPAPGPVLANYGLENLRFIAPVAIGDTIQADITVKQKIKKTRRPDEARATGVVVWDVLVRNQNDETVAVYDIMTLVERKEASQ
ncbi:phenylacetic acid degradation bifunctional protein PaaZ [Enterovibrio norvegicus]|uniref:phenylacetic acid degradation bifunctional protein PaaZ n=1 Tax=Enterovibrio norvegicus TaxID=188144 RepID=UPI0010BE957B|nr:phenylacetic acid degradation bifunctional protein PaaZ [Enterovibrio norvegicus]TKF37023.1 phenylacetic acid degradation bifunctional protein PaaZ [Enterovibrio norvegicus]